jgi:hypothetical protein
VATCDTGAFEAPAAELCVVNTLAARPELQATSGAPPGSPGTAATRRGRLDPATFRRLRDQVLTRSAGGRAYSALYQAHSPEVARLVLVDRELQRAVLEGLLLWQADLAALTEGRGGTVRITDEQVRAVEVVLDRLAQTGSPGLRQAIARERAAQPLRRFAGATLDHALADLTSGNRGR